MERKTEEFNIPILEILTIEIDKDIYEMVEINMTFPAPQTGKIVIKRRES
jgi:hypothetical protein